MHLLEYAIRINRVFIQETVDIPPIFWKYFDLYRRGKIDIFKFAQLSKISKKTIEIYLKIL